MTMTSNIALAELATGFWTFRCDEFPIDAIVAGVQTDADQLLRAAPKDSERRAAWARDALTELARIDTAALEVADRATHALLQREFVALIDTVEKRAHLRPSLFPLGPEFSLIFWAGATALGSIDEVRRYLSRLDKIAASLGSVMAGLAQGAGQGLTYPRLVVERAIEQVRGHVSMPVESNAFYKPLSRLATRGAAIAALAEQGQMLIASKVYAAFHHYADFLEATLLPIARDSLGCTEDLDGERFYRHNIINYTTVDLDPTQIHAIGLSEVDRISEEMRSVAAQAGFPDDLAGFRRRLQTDNQQIVQSGEALREQIEVLSKRIDARIPEFFGRTPRTTYGVSSIPISIAEKMPPAYAQPNPADGSAAGVHWITSIPAMCPRYMHLPIALHEAWPGHLMHMALIQEMEHLPDFRRYGGLRYSACLEGWALYCERLGEEMGLYDTPEKTYGRLEMEMWRAVRLVVDTGIHARRWTRDQAIAFFQAHMAMPIETIIGEVDRYIGFPAQALSYQIGNIKFRDLRERAEAMLGDVFQIRDFHDALMAAGPVTLPVLDMLIDNWIARVGQREAA